jgi:hypothetical protein
MGFGSESTRYASTKMITSRGHSKYRRWPSCIHMRRVPSCGSVLLSMGVMSLWTSWHKQPSVSRASSRTRVIHQQGRSIAAHLGYTQRSMPPIHHHALLVSHLDYPRDSVVASARRPSWFQIRPVATGEEVFTFFSACILCVTYQTPYPEIQYRISQFRSMRYNCWARSARHELCHDCTGTYLGNHHGHTWFPSGAVSHVPRLL